MNFRLKRLFYFFYYIKQTSPNKFRRYLNYGAEASYRSKLSILLDVFASTFKYNISLLDYFYFRFYQKSKAEREAWAGTGYMYEYHMLMNPKRSRHILENKIEFLNSYAAFVKRRFADLNTLKNSPGLAEDLLSGATGKIVLKNSRGQVGKEVKIYDTKSLSKESLIEVMNKNKFDLAEEFVVQHPALMALSSTGLNTVRIFTQLHNGNVDLLGARLRISVNSQVDNLGAGNIAAPLDMETGTVTGPGIYSDITRQDETIHPVTQQPIVGFRVPYWQETVAMIEKAALLHPENRSIGWDIAITANGPELIEGNHNWCKLLWQLPVKQGLKHMLEKYI